MSGGLVGRLVLGFEGRRRVASVELECPPEACLWVEKCRSNPCGGFLHEGKRRKWYLRRRAGECGLDERVQAVLPLLDGIDGGSGERGWALNLRPSGFKPADRGTTRHRALEDRRNIFIINKNPPIEERCY